jgi:hypothetical protein
MQRAALPGKRAPAKQDVFPHGRLTPLSSSPPQGGRGRVALPAPMPFPARRLILRAFVMRGSGAPRGASVEIRIRRARMRRGRIEPPSARPVALRQAAILRTPGRASGSGAVADPLIRRTPVRLALVASAVQGPSVVRPYSELLAQRSYCLQVGSRSLPGARRNPRPQAPHPPRQSACLRLAAPREWDGSENTGGSEGGDKFAGYPRGRRNRDRTPLL